MTYVSKINMILILLVFIIGSSALAQPGFAATPVISCGTLSADTQYILMNDVSSWGTCFTVSGDNVLLDGNSHWVNYSRFSPGYGINDAGGGDNLTLINLKIRQVNASMSSSHAIYSSGMSNSQIKNNQVITSGYSSYAVYLRLSSNSNNISSNSITTSSSYGYGVYLYSSSNSNTVAFNTIQTTGSYADGVRAELLSTRNNISNNTVTTSGYGVRLESSGINIVSGNRITSSYYGIYLRSSGSSNITENRVSTTGGSSYGIYLYSSSNWNNVSKNVISTSGWDSQGVYLYSSRSNNISDNAITTSGPNANGVYLYISSDLNSVYRNAITTSGDSSSGVYLQSSTGNNLSGNAMNTANAYALYITPTTTSSYYNHAIDTTNTEQGEPIYYYFQRTAPFVIQDLTNIGQLYVANSTGVVIQNVTLDKDGVILALTNDVQLRNSTISTSGNYVYGAYLQLSKNVNVTETVMDTSNAYAVYIEPSTNAAYYNHTIDIKNTEKSRPVYYYFGKSSIIIQNLYNIGQLIVANSNDIIIRNVTIINRDGITLALTTNVSVFASNISTSTQPGVVGIKSLWSSLGNFSGNLISTSGSNGYGIDLYSSNDNVISNNTVRTSGGTGYGMRLEVSGRNAIFGNSISTTGSYGRGIRLYSSSNLNNITRNTIGTSNSDAYGVSLEYSSNSNNLSNNNITTSGSSGYGVEVYSSSNLNNVSDNNIKTLNSYGYGIHLEWSNSNSIKRNSIATSGSYGRGVRLYYSDLNKVLNNNITTSNSDAGAAYLYSSDGNNVSENVVRTSNTYADGIFLGYGSISNFVSSNRIVTSGSASGVIFYSSANSNTLLDNNVTALGTSYGVYMWWSASNTITGGSIVSASSRDYYLEGAGTTNRFMGTNFTGPRAIYFADNTSWFNYRNDTSSSIWLKAGGASLAGRVTRVLGKWNSTTVIWNDTNSVPGMSVVYVVSGLLPNKQYEVMNISASGKTSGLILATDIAGNLAPFPISLNGNTLIFVQKYELEEILSRFLSERTVWTVTRYTVYNGQIARITMTYW